MYTDIYNRYVERTELVIKTMLRGYDRDMVIVQLEEVKRLYKSGKDWTKVLDV